MSRRVLFDAPGPQDGRPAPHLHRRRRVLVLLACRRRASADAATPASSPTPSGSRSSPRATSQAIWSHGLAEDPADGRSSVDPRCRLRRGLRGRPSSPTTPGPLAGWLVVEFFRAVPVHHADDLHLLPSSAAWRGGRALLVGRHRADALQRRRAGRGLPGRHQRRAPGQAEAAYALGMRKTQVMTLDPAAAGASRSCCPAIISQCVVALKDTSLGYDHPGARPDPGRQVDLPGVPATSVPTRSCSPRSTSSANLVAHRGRDLGAAEVRRREGDAPGRGARRVTHGRLERRSERQAGLGVTQSRITPSTTTVPSSRTPRTRTGTSGSSPVHCAGSVSAMQVMSLVALAV